MTDTTLDRMCAGDCAAVDHIVHFPLKNRLLDIGMRCGSPIRCLSVSPLGDPVAYEICGAVIALRRSDARHVTVREAGHYAG